MSELIANLAHGMGVALSLQNIGLCFIGCLVGLWVRLLKVPYRLMFPTILIFCCVGIYSINSQPTDILLIGLFGLVGYVFIKFGFEPAPLLLGFVLGDLLEENLRRALTLSHGDISVLVTRPISAGLLALSVVVLALALLPSVQKERDEVFAE